MALFGSPDHSAHQRHCRIGGRGAAGGAGSVSSMVLTSKWTDPFSRDDGGFESTCVRRKFSGAPVLRANLSNHETKSVPLTIGLPVFLSGGPVDGLQQWDPGKLANMERGVTGRRLIIASRPAPTQRLPE